MFSTPKQKADIKKSPDTFYEKMKASALWLLTHGLMAGVAGVMLWSSQYVFFCAVMAVMISQPLIINWANNLHAKRTRSGGVKREDLFRVVDRSVFVEWLQRAVAFSTYVCMTPLTRALVAIMPFAALARIPLLLTIGMQTWMTHYARENVTRSDNTLVTDGRFGFTRRMSLLMFVMPLIQTIALYAKELELTSALVTYIPYFTILTGNWVFYLGVSLAFYGAVQLIQSSLYAAAFDSGSTPLDNSLKDLVSEQKVNNEDQATMLNALSRLSKLEQLVISNAWSPNPEKAVQIAAIKGHDQEQARLKAERDAAASKKIAHGGVTNGVIKEMGVGLEKDKKSMQWLFDKIQKGEVSTAEELESLVAKNTLVQPATA